MLDEPDDVMFLRYNELRALIGDPQAHRRAGDRRRERRAERERGVRASGRATGSAPRPRSQLAFPYLANWGFPEKFHRGQAATTGGDHGHRRLAGRGRGDRPRRARRVDEFDAGRATATSSSAR